MSIDLEWAKLDSSLATYVVTVLNKQLSVAERPSFIGPIEVTSLDFGSNSPDVELVDLRDIYRDFLDDSDDDSEDGLISGAPVKVTEGADDDDGFEWVSRRAAGREDPLPPSMTTSAEQQSPSPAPPQEPPQNPHPNLQLHFLVNWQSNLRITISTSLLINYPSPMFMSLPIKLSVTGIEFSGEVAVAYEGERRRIHLCILDELDPYGPAGDRPKRESPLSGVPPELDEDEIPTKPSKPLPVGQRLLPSIVIESEIGQQDKHVLKNVTRIERFIQDVIRKTVEEELVFPNFHTLVMGDQ
ncbi:hypothetical protein FA13DRAFT_1636660 [Coprinellus micaceus]|uniref:Mitochondrial distribution and morphology protein 12 n=1 Tax=Coprinellus micaceus TaxID=71717 RepID=A0A4Y7SWI7_COPMI|nr:hypothetical protein FA13DRAFT_1636660 [Coprinellus micaceus]